MKRRILVVDDKQAILAALQPFLQSMTYDVDCASNLDWAKALIANKDYALVLSDLRLTGSLELEGLEIVRAAREKDPLVRIVILTAYGSPEVVLEAKRLRVDAVLHKPQPLREVVRLIDELLKGEASAFAGEG